METSLRTADAFPVVIGRESTTGNASAVRRLCGNERRPKGDAFGKRRFPSEARSESLLLVRSHYLRRFSRALDTILPGLKVDEMTVCSILQYEYKGDAWYQP